MQPHAHHHPPGPHPHDHRVQVMPSLLRLSALERLAAGAVIIAVLWAAILWAMS